MHSSPCACKIELVPANLHDQKNVWDSRLRVFKKIKDFSWEMKIWKKVFGKFGLFFYYTTNAAFVSQQLQAFCRPFFILKKKCRPIWNLRPVGQFSTLGVGQLNVPLKAALHIIFPLSSYATAGFRHPCLVAWSDFFLLEFPSWVIFWLNQVVCDFRDFLSLSHSFFLSCSPLRAGWRYIAQFG